MKLLVNLPQAHDVMSIGIDSNGKVTNFPFLSEFLFTVMSAHVMPKPLALRVIKLLITLLIHLKITANIQAAINRTSNPIIITCM